MGFGNVVSYYWIRIPEFLSTILPITLLLALLYTLTHLAKHNELIAMRAAGVSWWRLCTPYFLIGVILSLALFAINEKWGARSAETASNYMDQHRKGSTSSIDQAWHDQAFFQNLRDKRQWVVRKYNTETFEMLHPFVVYEDSQSNEYRIQAKSAIWTNSVWTFYDADEIRFEISNGTKGSFQQSFKSPSQAGIQGNT